jgi:mRNA interferase YafQ
MREIDYSTLFRRDLKRLQRQSKDFEKMRRAIDMLRTETLIPQIYKDHPLKGNWRGRREMHIAPDWLLIYHVENDTVYLDRTGSHAELLKR